MITEDYVSFETAKLLKEKGFDSECDYLYVDGNIVRAQGGKCNWNSGETLFTDYKNECSAPTLQMAMKWLREAHNIIISIFPTIETDMIVREDYSYAIYKNKISVYQNCSITYEQACEAAIKYCLEKLI